MLHKVTEGKYTLSNEALKQRKETVDGIIPKYDWMSEKWLTHYVLINLFYDVFDGP